MPAKAVIGSSGNILISQQSYKMAPRRRFVGRKPTFKSNAGTAGGGLKARAHRQINTDLALKAYRLAKQNAKSIDYDHIQGDNAHSNVQTSSGWQVKQFGVAEGDTTGTRQGEEIFIRKLWIKGVAKTLSSTTQATIVRVIVGWCYDSQSFAAANLIGNGTERALYGMLDKKGQSNVAHSKFKVYKDFRFTVNVVGDEAKKYFEAYVPVMKKQYYVGSASGGHKGGPFVAFHVDQTDVSGVNVDYDHIMTYTR